MDWSTGHQGAGQHEVPQGLRHGESKVEAIGQNAGSAYAAGVRDGPEESVCECGREL